MYSDERYHWFWPPAYDPEHPPDVETILRMLDAQLPASVLDLACGLGWLTIAMALRGFAVTGSDLSDQMLSNARSAAAAAGAEVTWHQGDMRMLPDAWSSSFNAVTLTLSEFGCFDDADNQVVLDGVSRVLRPGGRFLLDVVANRDGLVNVGDRRSYLEFDGLLVAEDTAFDLLQGTLRRSYHWFEHGERQECSWQIRVYTPAEVVKMLTRAGLQLIAAHDNLSGAPLRRDSGNMTFVAEKPH